MQGLMPASFQAPERMKSKIRCSGKAVSAIRRTLSLKQKADEKMSNYYV